MIQITKVFDIQKEQDFGDDAICRLHTSVLRDTDINRNDWIKITNNKDTSKYIFRRVKGGSPKNSSKHYIELDYDSRLELGIKEKCDEVDLIAEKATYFEIFKANWNYPNYAIKLAFRLAVLSVVLGFIGVIK